MSCCSCINYGWNNPEPLIYRDSANSGYCIFHAPADKKGISTDEFNEIIYKRINGYKHDLRFVCNLAGTVFPGDIIFADCNKMKQMPHIIFNRAVFEGRADFRNVNFSEAADFRGVLFKGEAIFTGAEFYHEAFFTDAKFSDKADFNRTDFKNSANFRRSGFSSMARFSGAFFSGMADLSLVSFKNETDFNRSCFKWDATFNGTLFVRTASFIDATFNRNANFNLAGFAGGVQFINASFGEDAFFARAIFSGKILFNSVKFHGWTLFNNAAFRDAAEFNEAMIAKKASFPGAYAEKNSLHFHFLKKESLSNIYFTCIETDCFSFKCSEWPDKLYVEKQDNPDTGECLELYRSLKLKAISEQDHGMISRWHLRERLMQLEQIRHKHKLLWRFSFASLYNRCSGFGEDPVRAAKVFVLFCMILVSGICGFALYENGAGNIFDSDRILKIFADFAGLFTFAPVQGYENMGHSERLFRNVMRVAVFGQGMMLVMALKNRFRR